MSGLIPNSGLSTVRVPSTLFKFNRLRNLSGCGLRLALAVSQCAYEQRSVQVKMNFMEIQRSLLMTRKDVKETAKELRSFGVLDFALEGDKISFHLCNPDSTKAENYLKQYSRPALDADSAQTNIEVV
jgi:hypothetical protein